MKTCISCGVVKNEEDFYVDNRRKGKGGQRKTECKFCFKERININRLRRIQRVTEDEYSLKLREQNGLCAICGKLDQRGWRLSQDHDHITLQSRGLLCMLCNTALGQLQDSPELLRNALVYLRKWGKE